MNCTRWRAERHDSHRSARNSIRLINPWKDTITEEVGSKRMKARRASCKMVIAKDRQKQGARHFDCGPEITGCQAEDNGTTKALFILQRGDLSTLGATQQAGQGCASQAGEGVSI